MLVPRLSWQYRRYLPGVRIACCYAAKGRRRSGVATAALAGALDLIARLGGGVVEGYPEPPIGACRIPLQRRARNVRAPRFTRVGMFGKHRRVATTTIQPTT
jgi:hypothetical protein